jgi:hypothetical protein
MSIGPASTELVVNLILDRGDEIPEALRSGRAV